ncbi:hypothetical protein EEB18_021395 [Sphingopyxis sp. OPL5]|uniref:DUF6306 domain-containing protein n=1 Tax=Sphingopyxis sp. OPL5 TaxID=2486273 RepID=UPI00164CEC03|nr:DUF6306 domain-containing protein [Sphingopyxis sp. OPL5]QNO27226.1 hypothetical protein EEB18_021395 [Sphingopyxis sp. OPL5]
MTEAIDKSAVLAALNELLEAERAGARVALVSRKQARTGYADLMRQVHVDESRWCEMLSRQISRLGGEPSPACGAFFTKAIAISEPLDRLAFLNRGQSWVVRKLEALLAQREDEDLRSDLQDMLDSHRTNIDAAADFLAAAGK